MGTSRAVWTVMVYLAGDNNLTAECLFALTEMKKADPGDRIKVIAQFDPQDSFLPTRRYEINRKGPSSSLLDDMIDSASYDSEQKEVRFVTESTRACCIADLRRDCKRGLKSGLPLTGLNSLLLEAEEETSDTDTGSPITLYNFLSFCLEHYPAEHYLVVLSGHAGGTDSDYLLTDESPRGSLTFNELKEVFRQLQDDLGDQTIDIIGMDNCLMSMAEICYELRGTARVLVGCESYSPSGGWPYRQIIRRLREDLELQDPSNASVALKAGKAIVEEYVKYYSQYWMAGLSVSQSALNLQRVELLRTTIDSLGNVLEAELSKEHALRLKGETGATKLTEALVLAHWESQSYNGETYVDLYDFCECLQKRIGNVAIVEQCEKMKRVIAEEFVLKSGYWGASYQYSYGVSIYFPWAHISRKYANLDFVKNSEVGWLRFLRTATTVTRRGPRGAERLMELQQSSGLNQGRALPDSRRTFDRMSFDRMLGNAVRNPVQSMRNPPVTFISPELLEEHKG
jgi:hypothetical protein